MANQDVSEDPSQQPPNNSKKWILKVSIHCEGCKRKVKKLLSQVEGVYDIEIDTRPQKVTVIGNVDANTLLRKLNKSGKHAELWPENPNQYEKKPATSARKEKAVLPHEEKSQSNTANNAKEIESPPVKAEIPAQEPAKVSQGGGANNAGGGEGDGAAKAGTRAKITTVEESGTGGNSKEINEATEELDKSEGKKPETESGSDDGARPQPPKVAAEGGGGGDSEKSTATPIKVGGGGNDGVSVKKKKKKGQNVNNQKVSEGQQSDVAATNEGPRDHESGTQDPSPPDHLSRTRQPMYGQYPPHQFYGPPGPPPPQPIYATVSYNTAQPTSSYTASYYAAAPPNSYVYSFPGDPRFHAPAPSDFDAYSTRQPLDSFEMFSDENPNGCLIM